MSAGPVTTIGTTAVIASAAVVIVMQLVSCQKNEDNLHQAGKIECMQKGGYWGPRIYWRNGTQYETDNTCIQKDDKSGDRKD